MGKFEVGEKAVYPAYGVGEVIGIESKEIMGRKNTFYIVKIKENEMTIMVPTENACSVGLRRIINKSDVDQVLSILRQKQSPVSKKTWNRRHREYMEKLRTGSAFEIAEVVRELCALHFRKGLSFSERKVYEMAKNLLIQEIALAISSEETNVQREIDAILTN